MYFNMGFYNQVEHFHKNNKIYGDRQMTVHWHEITRERHPLGMAFRMNITLLGVSQAGDLLDHRSRPSIVWLKS